MLQSQVDIFYTELLENLEISPNLVYFLLQTYLSNIFPNN